jgi:hypothetical protein
MTIERRLIDALHELDDFEPSADLFARVERSLVEDRAFRRRRLLIAVWVVGGLAGIVAWVALSAQRGVAGNRYIEGWRLTLAYLALAGATVIAIAPHIRRFGRSFIDDVFHLSPETGKHFLIVLDIAYYTTFTGMVLVDADAWGIGDRLLLLSSLEDLAFRFALLLLAMGLLHAVNIAFLPVLGLIYNSIVRLDLRRRAGEEAPSESMRARTADRHARSFAIAIAVTALAVALTVLMSGPGGLILGGLD